MGRSSSPWFVLATTMLAEACGTAGADTRFVVRTPHEGYQAQLRTIGLDTTALGRQWLEAAQRSLSALPEIQVPHREARYLDPAGAVALGYRLRLARGQRLVATVEPPPADGDLRVFLDLFSLNGDTAAGPVTSADAGRRRLTYPVYQSGDYVLRIQPELLSGGRVTINLATELGFPVAGQDAEAIIGQFGDARDGGQREHEGVDIFAPLGTPAIATVAGRVTAAGEDRLGGNVVWVEDDSTGHRLYYAHLERSVVRSGDAVVPGDTLGFVGNTGNARQTLPHLHFAVYGPGGGAVDPTRQLRDRLRVAPLVGDPRLMGRWARVATAEARVLARPERLARVIARLTRGAPVEVLAATGRWYLARLPGVGGGYLATREVRPLGPPERRSVAGPAALLAAPAANAASLGPVEAGEELVVLGRHQGHLLVQRSSGVTGWLARGSVDARGVTQAPKPILSPPTVQLAGLVVPASVARQSDGGSDSYPARATPVDAAGTWHIQAVAEDKDSLVIAYQLHATGGTVGWVMVLPGHGDRIPVTVTPGGDSVVMDAEPFASAFQRDGTAKMRSIVRWANGLMEGSALVRFPSAGADSVLTLRLRGMKAQPAHRDPPKEAW